LTSNIQAAHPVGIAPSTRPRLEPSSSNIPLIQELGASVEVRALFARYRERFARTELPGIVLCFATNAALLEGMLKIAEGLLFGPSLLSSRIKEMIATYLSAKNACSYCAESHGVMLEAQGASTQQVCTLRNGELQPQQFSSAEVALLTFAEQINRASSSVTRDDVRKVMDAGWTETQVAEAVHIAALFAAFNRIANGFGLAAPFSDSE
jgi:uncharacterized peroxidase-related enzyme